MFLFREFTIIEKKEIRTAIRQIYGVGWWKANFIINKIGISYPNNGTNINDYYIYLIIFLLKGFVLSDSKIKRIIDNNINKLLINFSYKGTRHKLTLPVRGQRTRTNSATQRSKRNINNN